MGAAEAYPRNDRFQQRCGTCHMIKIVSERAHNPDNSHDPIHVSTLSFGRNWHASSCSLRNSRDDCLKPNEDRVVIDPVRESIVVADGITRSRSANGSYPFISPSAQVAALFCETVSELLSRSLLINEEILRRTIAQGNQAIAQFNKEHFPDANFAENDIAGIAAIVGIVDGHRLWLASIADCFSLATTPLCVERLAWEKTSHAADEYKRLGEQEARRSLRNNPDSPFGYGAFTGEEIALSFVQYQCINIQYAQRLIFATDGLLPLADELPTIFMRSPPQQVMTTACELERRLGETDDKTLVILDRRV